MYVLKQAALRECFPLRNQIIIFKVYFGLTLVVFFQYFICPSVTNVTNHDVLNAFSQHIHPLGFRGSSSLITASSEELAWHLWWKISEWSSANQSCPFVIYWKQTNQSHWYIKVHHIRLNQGWSRNSATVLLSPPHLDTSHFLLLTDDTPYVVNSPLTFHQIIEVVSFLP